MTVVVDDGYCLSACVAVLLKLPVGSVPAFGTAAEDNQQAQLDNWLKQFGLYSVRFDAATADGWYPPGLYILGGTSPRRVGTFHAVVARGPEVIYDLHPSGDGVVDRTDLILIVPFDPSEALA